MSNFLEYTLKALGKHGKTPEDVSWVGSKDGKLALSWVDFRTVADFDYDTFPHMADSSFPTLVIVGADWWMTLDWVHDSVQKWVYKEVPKRDVSAEPFVFQRRHFHGSPPNEWVKVVKVDAE